jgi:RNA polymerase sigma-70 factor, ECF subfamily
VLAGCELRAEDPRVSASELLEADIRALHEAGDVGAAARKSVEGYGPEVFSFLVNTLRDEDQASDVFADACEDLWRGLPKFEWRASLRTWFYTLARNAASRWRRSPHRRAGRHVELGEAAEIIHQVRTRTLTYLRGETRSKIDELRNELPPDDHQLLILRVSRQLAWQDIARVLGGAESENDVAREAARLRKRFQLVKEKLREKAQSAGLLD